MEFLRFAIGILNRLDVNAWQAVDDRTALASLVSELVKAGNEAVKANKAAKTKEKAA